VLIFCEIALPELTRMRHRHNVAAMNKTDLDQRRLAYKKAVDEWVNAIRAEEALATEDHSMTAMEIWDDAHFREQDAQTKATEARDAYKDQLRAVNYGI
jgi:thymidylate synthase